MSSEQWSTDLNEAEQNLKEAEQSWGPDDVRLADLLDNYASLLRSSKTRILDAANMAARAKVLRAKNNNTCSEASANANASNDDTTRECPFCAEKIKAKAIVCRYCQKDLTSGEVERRNAKKNVSPPGSLDILVLVPVLFLFGLVWFFGIGFSHKPDPTKPIQPVSVQPASLPLFAKPTSTIHGTVWMESTRNNPIVMRDHKVYLCKMDLLTTLEANKYWQRIQAARRDVSQPFTGTDASLVDGHFTVAVNSTMVQETRTDIEGKYEFVDVPSGYYVLACMDNNEKQKCVVFWAEPFEAQAPQTKQDLTDSNVAAVGVWERLFAGSSE